MLLLETQADVNLLVFYALFFTVFIGGFSIMSLIRSNINKDKIIADLSESLYECRENTNNFNEIEQKLESYERDIEEITRRRRGRKP